MNLKEQTVYTIDIESSSNLLVKQISPSEHICHVNLKENHYCLSKEELIELLGKAFEIGNGSANRLLYPSIYKNRKDNLINNILHEGNIS